MTGRVPVRMTECRNCGEPIVFVKLDTGNAMPCNPLPMPHNDRRGNVIARVVGGRMHGWVESKANPHEPGFLRMRPHWATCAGNDQDHHDQQPLLGTEQT